MIIVGYGRPFTNPYLELEWYIVDWGYRVLFISIFFLNRTLRQYVFSACLCWPTLSAARDTILGAFLVLGIDYGLRHLLFWIGMADGVYGTAPTIYDPAWVHGFDLTIGLVLVAVAEELIYRVGFVRECEKRKVPVGAIYFIGTIVFAFAHWGSGLFPVIFAGAFAPVFIWLFRQHGSIWPITIIHYIYNFLIFSGVINILY